MREPAREATSARRQAALPKIKVLIADDHALVRRGFAAIINMEEDVTVVGEAGNGEEAVELCHQLRIYP